MVLFRQ